MLYHVIDVINSISGNIDTCVSFAFRTFLSSCNSSVEGSRMNTILKTCIIAQIPPKSRKRLGTL